MACPSRTMQTQMAIDPKDRPKYNKDQLHIYFKRICLPQEYLSSTVLSDSSLALTTEYGLPLLQALSRYHICNVPFENLEIHYSASKGVSLDMNDLYITFSRDGHQYGRGGRCMENNSFFGTVLRSLGYDVRNCAARVSRMMNPNPEVRKTQGNTYNGWTHMLNLVRLDARWYVVDVGMGAMGPNIVYPLQDGYEVESVHPRRIRLQKRSIPERAAPNQDEPKLWCFDVCLQPSAEGRNTWVPTYCFTETEYLPQDYEVMSWFTSTSPKSFFTKVIMCQKMILDESGENIVGDITLLRDTIFKTTAGNKKRIRQCKTEKERVAALGDYFGLHLTSAQQKAISSEMRLK